MSRSTLSRLAPALLLAAVAAGALVSCTTPEEVRSPIWTGSPSTPSGQEFTPERALREGKAGHVMVLCRSHVEDGSVSDCRVAYEYPKGYGFGASALRMMSGIDVRRTTRGAVRPDGLVLVPVRFCPDEMSDCAAPDDGPWPMHWGDPRLERVPLPPPVRRPGARTPS